MVIEYRGRFYDFRNTNPQFRGINEIDLKRLVAKDGEIQFDTNDGSIYMYVPGLGWGLERRN